MTKCSHEKLPAKFPHRVKVGAVTVHIYRCKSRRWKGRQYFVFAVVYPDHGRRKRKNFASFAAALAEAQEIATRIARGTADVLQLSSVDRASYVSSINLLRPTGIPLHSAIEEYIAARSHLNGESLLSAAKEHARRHRHHIPDRTVREIVDEILAAKERDGLSDRYIETLRSHLNRFACGFETVVGAIGAKSIEDWLSAQNVGPRARNNIRMSVVTLFNFARARGYLPKGQPTEAEDVSKARDRGGKIEIFRADQLAGLLIGTAKRPSKLDDEAKLYLALGAFTGVRAAELIRLEWGDVNFARGHIVVGKDKAKTATRRLIPIQPNLMVWIAPYRDISGRIFVSEHSAGRAIAQVKDAGIEWPNNVLRHSYGSYRLAQTNDAARVALEMGNSPALLFRSYRELADEKEAADWFGIVPTRAANIVSIRAALRAN